MKYFTLQLKLFKKSERIIYPNTRELLRRIISNLYVCLVGEGLFGEDLGIKTNWSSTMV